MKHKRFCHETTSLSTTSLRAITWSSQTILWAMLMANHNRERLAPSWQLKYTKGVSNRRQWGYWKRFYWPCNPHNFDIAYSCNFFEFPTFALSLNLHSGIVETETMEIRRRFLTTWSDIWEGTKRKWRRDLIRLWPPTIKQSNHQIAYFLIL